MLMCVLMFCFYMFGIKSGSLEGSGQMRSSTWPHVRGGGSTVLWTITERPGKIYYLELTSIILMCHTTTGLPAACPALNIINIRLDTRQFIILLSFLTFMIKVAFKNHWTELDIYVIIQIVISELSIFYAFYVF